MFGKQEVIDFLNEKQIAFEKVEHDAVFTIEDMEGLGLDEKGEICKNLFLRDQKGKKHFLVVLPHGQKVDMASLSDALGAGKLSFASADRLTKYLKLTQGAVSPLGVLNDEEKSVIVVIDKGLEGMDRLGIHPNDNTATLFLSYKDLLKILNENSSPIKMY